MLLSEIFHQVIKEFENDDVPAIDHAPSLVIDKIYRFDNVVTVTITSSNRSSETLPMKFDDEVDDDESIFLAVRQYVAFVGVEVSKQIFTETAPYWGVAMENGVIHMQKLESMLQKYDDIDERFMEMSQMVQTQNREIERLTKLVEDLLRNTTRAADSTVFGNLQGRQKKFMGA